MKLINRDTITKPKDREDLELRDLLIIKRSICAKRILLIINKIDTLWVYILRVEISTFGLIIIPPIFLSLRDIKSKFRKIIGNGKTTCIYGLIIELITLLINHRKYGEMASLD